MQRFLAIRLSSLIGVLSVVAIVSFSLIQFAPGDPAQLILGQDATTEELASLRREMGLDRPVIVQLALWFWRILRGDFGKSVYYGEPVMKIIVQRLEPSALLSLMGCALAAVIGLPLGIAAATQRGRPLDRLITVTSVLGMSVPAFWLALNLILLFSIYLRWTPVSGYPGIGQDLWRSLRSLILPAISVGAAQSAWLARVTRSAMLEVLMQDYVRTARAKGLRERTVIYSHTLRNAILPVVTVIGIMLMTVFSSAIVIEEVFALPGVGRLATMSVFRRDYPTIQGIVLFVGVAYAFVNLVVDLLYVWLDPRVKY